VEKERSYRIRDIGEAINFIYSFINYEKKNSFAYNTRSFDIQKFQNILERLDSPHRKYKTIHVVGTKGKGSTCAILSSLLTQAGFKTGLYTSPHLEDIRERIMINGVPIDKGSFTSIIDRLHEFIYSNNLQLSKNFRTTFELLTATAFIFFAEKKVDYAVIEAGLGGRLDATNVISPEITIITSISLDHTNILGDSLEQIAYEKGGAIKKEIPVFISSQNERVLNVLENMCKQKEANPFILNPAKYVENIALREDGIFFDYAGEEDRLRKLWLPLPGDFQSENALLAIKGFYRLMAKEGISVNSAVNKGLEKVRWRGRLESLSKNPHIVADVAHNPYSMRRILDNIKNIYKYKKMICVLSISKNKDIPGLCRILSSSCGHFYVTCAEPTRSSSCDEIIQTLSEYSDKVYCEENPQDALSEALKAASREDLILITGSVYLVGRLLSYFDQDGKR